jgi:hypothetical protein
MEPLDVVYVFLVVCRPYIIGTGVAMLVAALVAMVLEAFMVLKR